jgi:hypothetical protein
LIALGQVPLFILSLFSNIYFLCGWKAGTLIVKGVLVEEICALKWTSVLILVLGYAHVQTCIEVDEWIRRRKIEGKGKEE